MVEHSNPTELNTVIGNKNLVDMTIPVVMKVCFKPNFNASFLKTMGYHDTYNYFQGFVGDSDPSVRKFVGWTGGNKTENEKGKGRH